MPNLHISARHVKKVDTRYIVSRDLRFQPNLASVDLFPADPSPFQQDLVWVEDVQHLMRRQPAVAGPDGLYPVVDYRTKGQLQWDIPLRVWRTIDPNIEDATTDPVINPRQRRLRAALFKSRIEREIAAWQILRDPAVLTQNVTLSAGSRFDDITSTSSDPIATLQLGAEKIFRQTGLKVTDIYIPAPGLRMLSQHEKVMSYAVNKLNLNGDRLLNMIDANTIERLLDSHYIVPGAIKSYDLTFNNTNDSPSATSNETLVYPSGPMVVMVARAIPGGSDGIDYGFGLGKYLSVLDQPFKDDPTVQIATGNQGYGVYSFPEFNVAGGGTQNQLVDAWSPFVQNAQAAYAIYGAFNAADTANYGQSFSF